MIVKATLSKNDKLTQEQIDEIENAKNYPITYDEDSPELTDAMEQAFVAERKKNPIKGRRITLYVSDSTIEKAKEMGNDYMTVLGKILDKAVLEYQK